MSYPKLNKEFELDGLKYNVVKFTSCGHCDLYAEKCDNLPSDNCSAKVRHDHTSVMFVLKKKINPTTREGKLNRMIEVRELTEKEKARKGFKSMSFVVITNSEKTYFTRLALKEFANKCSDILTETNS